MAFKKIITLILCFALIFTLGACSDASKENRVEDIITIADTVLINGEEKSTVEAKMGAFEGKQGDYIEFRFTEEQTFNTVFINEKSTSVRQFNIYAEVDGKYMLLYTGKHILNENIAIEETTATAIKFQVVNTEIGNDAFTITGISAYNLKEN